MNAARDDIELTPNRAVKNAIILTVAQAVLGAQMSILFLVAVLSGQTLANNVCFATLPVTMTILGSALSARPMSWFMQHQGRVAGFMLGCLGGTAGAALGAYAVYSSSFMLLLCGSFLSGIYLSSQGFFKFAASDTAGDKFRPIAISMVMSGGLVAAILGTQLAKATMFALPIPFLATYLCIAAINIIGAAIFLFLDIPTPTTPEQGDLQPDNRWRSLKNPQIVVAIICASVSFGLMNLIMSSTPLAVVGCGYGEDAAADVILAHVLAMYLPSFFTGFLIALFGSEKIIALGLLILASAGASAISGVELTQFYAALILLGVGWNFGVIGATTMLTNAQDKNAQGFIQGINEMVVFCVVAIASVTSGILMNCSGGDVVQGWTTVNMAMVPLLVLAGGSLIWLVLKPTEEAA